MCKVIHADVETRSPVDLRKQGAFVYFEHPETTVLMMAYRLDDQPIRMWTYDRPCPDDLRAALEGDATIVAYNSQFETLAFDLLADRKGWPRVSYDRYVDTAAAAVAMGLPRALGDLAEALGLPVQKDKEGGRLIRLFSMPRRPRKGEDPTGLYWNEPQDHPEDWQKFLSYCARDVETEEAAAERLVPLSDFEQQVWLLDQKINRRGARVDRISAVAATNLAEKAKKALDREMRIVTGGYVPACSNPGKLIEWVQAQGVALDSAAKAEITDLLELDDLPDHVRRALEIRQEAAKTSVAKLTSMISRASPDDRIRGGFMYHGASTGRWVSTGVNLANLPRPRKIFDDTKPNPEQLFQAFRQEDPDLLPFLYGPELGRPLHLLSDAIRGFIIAAPGHEFVQADYSNIEGNVIAWSSNEEWKLKAIHELNADPSLPDMYRRTAAAILGLTTEEVTKKHWARQAVGKPAELGLAYGGGVMAFVTFARAYGVKLDSIAANIIAQADQERIEKATKRYEGQAKRGLSGTVELSRDAWIACEIVKLGWRTQNAAIAQSWKDLENAVREAVASPGRIVGAAKVDYLFKNGFLWARLPSGRCLAYGTPKLKAQVWAKVKLDDGTWSDSEVMDKEAAEAGEVKGTVKIEGATSDKVTVLGVDSKTKKWRRYGLYGGLLAENNTQAIARDILVNGMFKAEAAGYPIIATVYDEILTEVPIGYGDLADFERLICELPSWAAGLPLTAGGFRSKRYKKD
jgi:DNA polymerase